MALGPRAKLSPKNGSKSSVIILAILQASDTTILNNIRAEARTIAIDPEMAHEIHAVWAIQGMLQH